MQVLKYLRHYLLLTINAGWRSLFNVSTKKLAAFFDSQISTIIKWYCNEVLQATRFQLKRGSKTELTET